MAEHGLVRPFLATIRRAGKAQKFITLLLLFILLTTATAGVTAVLTGPDWTALWESLLIGLLVGWGLAILRWPAWRSALLVTGLGVLFCLLFAGGLYGKVLAVLDELFRQAGNIPIWLKTREVDLTALRSVLQQLITATGVVLARVFAWMEGLAAGQAAFDPVAAGIVWSLVVWLVSAWAGWMVEAGHRPLIAVLPALSLNLSTLSYGRSSSITIYLMLGLTLVLIAVVQYDHRQQEWEETQVAYPQHKGRQMGNTSLVIAIGLVFLAAFLSSLSLRRISQWTSPLNRPSPQQESGLAKSLGIQQPTTVPDSFSTARSPGLPRDLLIGAGPELSREEVMSVSVSDLTSLVQAGQLPPLYWRSFTYDIYTGHGWSSSPTRLTQYQPDQPFQPGLLPDHQLIQEMVNPVPGQAGTLYAAGEPVVVDISSSAAWRSSNDLFGVQTGNTSYTIQSLVPIVNEVSLRAAGQDYPAWVTQRYLALPAEVPNRVRQLAIQLTATQPTLYDRARAIELHLRSTYPYTTDVPFPPANQDLADYFLFNLRKGYCDYYASAMVVLARAAGIPARLVIGYATGTYNQNSNRFIVTQADAHSWVEVYFPGIGWVPFEPTAGLPAFTRSEQATQQATPAITPTKETHAASPVIPGGIIGEAALSLSAVVGFALVMYDEIHLKQLEPRKAAAEIYRRMRRYGRLLKVTYENGQTANEYGLALATRISTLNMHESSRPTGLTQDIQTIIQRIVRLSYRSSETGGAVRAQIIHQWRSLRWQLRLMWGFMLWKSIRQLFLREEMGYADQTHAPLEQE